MHRTSDNERQPTVISQRERNELRSMIRARFKAQRAGVEQRRSEQLADIERQINARYAEQTALFRAVDQEARRMVGELNVRLRQLYAPLVGDHPEYGGFAPFTASEAPDLERQLIRARAPKEVDARAKSALFALAALAALEADALEAVAMTAIESGEARRLMAELPSLEQLMPMIELPPAAAETVAKMTDQLMPWRNSDYGELDWRQREHVRDWRKAQAALPPAAEE